MEIIDIVDTEKNLYNKVVNHPLQSYEWGEFRKKTGVKVVRKAFIKGGKIVDGFTITIHKIPKLNYNIGYLPKGNSPSEGLLKVLKEIGIKYRCIFIQLEPNILKSKKTKLDNSLKNSFHPLFTNYTFILNLEQSEEELLKNFHAKTRYNIKVAKKHDVKVTIETSEKSFKEYLRLTKETTSRQRFFAHSPDYHMKMWETLKVSSYEKNRLQAHLMTTKYKNKTLTAWVLFTFHNTLYYPYGASSAENRNVMASNLIMWEAILYGKKLGLKHFDMWGALGPNPNNKDPWYGFHKFKEGYGGQHVEFVGSYDLVINPVAYQLYKVADKARWTYLRLKRFI